MDPEAAARARNAKVLAEAGIERQGYSTGQATSGIGRPSFGPPGMRGGLTGAGGPPVPGPHGPAHAAVQPAGDFASDYSDPLLGSAAVAPTGAHAHHGPIPGLPPGGELLLSGQVECPDCHSRQPAGHRACLACGKNLSLSQPVPDFGDQADLLLAESNHKLKCPECDTVQAASNKKCTNCGHDLTEARKAKFANLSDQEKSDLMLAELSSAERNKLPDSAFVFPKDRRYPIHDEAHAKNALARCSGKPEEATVKAAVYKKYPSLKPKGQDLSQEGHAVSLYDTLQLAKKADDGLIWKAICKTGELALSPGPGQIDVEKPLRLTKDLFEQLVLSVEERAFPYVTIPTTHANGLLENTGYVRHLAIEPSTDPADPPGTEVLWAAMEFTEPSIRERIERGTIPDTSVGVKFGYRNKRTGKHYPAALEHVALTHQPWVDGLTPFGAGLSQEGVFDAAEAEPEWEGVYMSVDSEEEPLEDILSQEDEIDGIPASFFSSEPMPKDRKHTRQADPAAAAAAEARRRAAAGDIPDSVEELLASHQVQIDAKDQRISELELRLAQQEGRTSSQATAMHLSNVQAQVTEWEKAQLPPAWIKEAKDILLAAGPPPAEVTEDNAVLTLSITKEPETEGATPEVVEQHMSVQDIVNRLALAVPRFAPGMEVSDIMTQMDELNAAQNTGGEGKSAEERAAAILEEAEKRGAGAGVV